MELTNCHKADIYAVGGAPICEARVFGDSAGLYQLLEVPAGFVPAEDSEYIVIFFDSTVGLVRSRCQLRLHGEHGEDVTNSDFKSLSFTVLEILETIQRRQDLKVPAVAEIQVEVTSLSGGSENPPPKAPFAAVTENLSAGGVYFVCQYALPPDTEVRFELREGPKPIDLTAVVLRQEELSPKKRLPRFGHGCRFINLKPAAESGLRSYIFRCQRDMRQRRK